jgi:hypothetical protein
MMPLGTGVIGGGKFPSVVASTTTGSGGPVSSGSVNLPAGITVGELLLVHCSLFNATASGWAQAFVPTNSGDGTVLWKIATGSEGSTVTVSNGGGTQYLAAIAWRISGGKSVEAPSTPATGSSTTPTPASLTPSWGKRSTLWFAMFHSNGLFQSAPTVSAYPSGFSGAQQQNGSNASGYNTVSAAWQQDRVATKSPGAFTLNASRGWASYTIGIKP